MISPFLSNPKHTIKEKKEPNFLDNYEIQKNQSLRNINENNAYQSILFSVGSSGSIWMRG